MQHPTLNNIVWHKTHLNQEARSKLKNQKPCIVWFTGLSGSGKSTIANALEAKLYQLNHHTYLLDGDNIRHGLNRDLGFDEASRVENIRRIGEVAKLFVDSGVIVLTAFISPFVSDRAIVRSLVEEGEFIEVFIDTPIEVCQQRDPKGLYQKALSGEIKNFTGIDSPYEAPKKPEIHLKTDTITVDEGVNQIVEYLKTKGYIC
ncbi:MAG: adenylylsulfate kinase [Sulfurovum sp. FS08-3]|nr:MAG: adenylylsulfate kinase [Sulfurovum sp. FS08-3]